MTTHLSARMQKAALQGHCLAFQQFLHQEGVEKPTAHDVLKRLRRTKDLPGSLRWAVHTIPVQSDGARGALLEHVGNLWNACSAAERGANPLAKDIGRGPLEEQLIQQFIYDMQWELHPEQYSTQEQIDTAIAAFHEYWLALPRPELGGKTVRQAVRDERKQLGHSDLDWSFTMGITAVFDPPSNV